MELILSVGEAWMESARKYPQHRPNLGMLRFRMEGKNILSKFRVSDEVRAVSAQFMVNNMMRSGGSKNFVRSVSRYENKYNV